MNPEINPANPASPTTPVQFNQNLDAVPGAPQHKRPSRDGNQKSYGLQQKTRNFDFQPITVNFDNTIGKKYVVTVSKDYNYYYNTEYHDKY